MNRYFYFSPSGDGWRNLAADEYFLNTLGPDDFMLYFYRNENAVIIGRNQNPWQECNFAAMEKDGVQLVRRCSGGGAVYHDGGNLNFSFIAGEKHYDLTRQMEMIVEALAPFGVPARLSGRNDITAEGKKFSGNAFCARGACRQHHGTLLIHADLNAMQKYLNVSGEKLKSKGVKSVRSRVCNLSDFAPSLTCQQVAQALIDVCTKRLGPFTQYEITAEAGAEIEKLSARHASWEWRMGKSPKFDYTLERRFSWGGVQLGLNVSGGRITNAVLYTDAMDTGFAPAVSALIGLRFEPAALGEALRSGAEHRELIELGDYILENGL